MTSHEIRYLNARLVCARYGVSPMTLWRWARDEDLAFPSPMYIQRRRYWKETALSEWDIQPRCATKKRGREGKRPTVKVLRIDDLIGER